MATREINSHNPKTMTPSSNKRKLYAAFVAISSICAAGGSTSQDTASGDEAIDYGNHNQEWEDGPSSWEEFGHDNDPSVCSLPRITVEEWEAGRYWDGPKPVIVKNATDGWAALHNWKK